MTATIETRRLSLRRFTPDDLESLARLLGDPVTMRFWPRPYDREGATAWLERNAFESYERHGFGRQAVILRDTGELIGDAGLLRLMVDGAEVNDLGYIIDHRHHGRGYATEAAAALLAEGFARGLEEIHANMPADHVASRRVAERIGMRWIRSFRNARNRDLPTHLYGARNPAAGD